MSKPNDDSGTGNGIASISFNDGCRAASVSYIAHTGDYMSTLNYKLRYLRSRSRLTEQETLLRQAAQELKLREAEILNRLARAANHHDNITGLHLKRMAKFSAALGRHCGLTEDEAETLELAAPMHDIGKIGIPDAIIRRNGQLSHEQMRIMQGHTRIGYEILKDSSSHCLQVAAIIALHHHEKFDGSGYPSGLRGEAIPLAARIVALADVFDALTSTRSYKDAWKWDQAVAYIVGEKGKHFVPSLVDIFVAHIDDMAEIKNSLSDLPESVTASAA